MDLEKLTQAGKDLGLTGKELSDFIREQQSVLRDERQKEREAKEREREAKERERERESKEREYDREREDRERERQDREKEREHELAKLALQVDLEKAKPRHEPTPGAGSVRRISAPKLPPFDEERDDMDSYIERFERFAESQKWDQNTWALNLSALLKGKALDVYSRIPASDALNYPKLKEALLKRFRLTEDGFRIKFRTGRPEKGETPPQFLDRIAGYLSRWVGLAKIDTTYEALVDLLLREQLLIACGKELELFLREHKCKSASELATLAEQFVEAHGNGSGMNYVNQTRVGNRPRNPINPNVGTEKRCFICNAPGHIARDHDRVCRPPPFRGDYSGQSRFPGPKPVDPRARGPGNLQKDRVGACIEAVDRLQNCCVNNTPEVVLKCGHNLPVMSAACHECPSNVVYDSSGLPTVDGYVNDEHVTVLRDTGCSRVVVKRALVGDKDMTNDFRHCVLIDGTVRKVPIARILVDTPYFRGPVDALCMENPLYDLIIGNVDDARGVEDPDLTWVPRPEFTNPDQVNLTCDVGMGNDVVTNGNLGPSEPEVVIRNREVSDGIDTKGDTHVDDLLVTNSDIPTVAQAVQTRAQKLRDERPVQPLKTPKIDIPNLTSDEIKNAQIADKTLDRVRKIVGDVRKNGKYGTSVIMYRDGLLYRRYESPRVNFGEPVFQLVVPEPYRETVMRVAHEPIMGGHRGTRRMRLKIQSEFTWPGIRTDIANFRRSCDICQRTTPKGRVTRIPLGQMPLIDSPFERIAMDIIGPISPVSGQKNRYILTVVDYATRYPEAVALPTIETERVAEALVEIYSRMGVPREILTDMGSNFTSLLMKEVGRLLSVRQMTTTPYHPACNGLCERFNGTLKRMLMRLCEEKPKDWDRYIAPVLFAYREAPQESLGFSPFELLYGRTVRGPMAILKELWTNDRTEPDIKTTYQYVLDLKERLEETCRMAHEELQRSSTRYKKYYDRKAKNRQYKVGDRVLLLLPTDRNKLMMHWKGPYDIVEKIGVTDYKLNVDGKLKTFHANLLKRYETREPPKVASMAVVEDNPLGIDNDLAELPTPNTMQKETYQDVVIDNELTEEQKRQLEGLVTEYADVLTDLPGKTDLIEHDLQLTSSIPIYTRPYPIPFAMKEDVRKEIQKLLDMDIIEPSNSPYCSPIVIVKKPDKSNRICIDYRKINGITVFDPEPMPTAEAIFAKLTGDVYYSKIDLSKGYYQIPLKDEARDVCAFGVPDEGCYRPKRMPFGLMNAGATFTRMMRKRFKDIPSTDNLIDDLLIHTKTWDEHVTVLKQVFQALRESNLTARPTKCELGRKNIVFLGHTIGEGTIDPKPDLVDKIQKCPRPTTKTQVRSFIGTVGFYSKYIPNYAAVSSPLTDLTRKGCPNNVVWGSAQENAFVSLKAMLAKPPILRLPDFEREFTLRTDASDRGLGAILLQEYDGVKFPVAYASKKLSERERAFSTVERECLALVWGIKKFELYLFGTYFTVETDHQSLIYINRAKHENKRVMRWSLALQPYRFTVKAIKGKDNVGADFMSRCVTTSDVE